MNEFGPWIEVLLRAFHIAILVVGAIALLRIIFRIIDVPLGHDAAPEADAQDDLDELDESFRTTEVPDWRKDQADE